MLVNEKEIEQKNNQTSFNKKKQQITVLLLIICISCFLINSPMGKTICVSAFSFEQAHPISINVPTLNERVHNEKFLEWERTYNLDTYILPEGSIIRVNYTVLVTSLSNVSFISYFINDTSNVWTPNPPNFILAPGESFEKNFTLVKGLSEQSSLMGYYGSVLTESSNATVHWWYEVLFEGKRLSIGFLFFVGTLILVLTIPVFLKKKRKTS
ncbi:unnamed protein product [marine sediment metagenome]|uniref:Uncharacterized protein n=1 Tax=marine sediment metagenome TaxID=412755 RepID=X1TF90_9ZZZZ